MNKFSLSSQILDSNTMKGSKTHEKQTQTKYQ